MPAVTPTRTSAVRKLERSQLDPAAIRRATVADDLDVEKLRIYLHGTFKIDADDRLTEARVVQTVEGSSTLNITINDYDRALLKSGLLSSKLDIEIEGLWFRLVQVKKSGDNLTLVLEDREIAVLRTYNKKIWASRATTTRAEFVYRMIREVKEMRIPVEIPELRRVQPIEVAEDDSLPWEQAQAAEPGIPDPDPFVPGVTDFPKGKEYVPFQTDFPSQSNREREAADTLTVKGAKATLDQVKNANTILRVGQNMGCRRKMLVCAIMTAITESRIINNPGGDADSAGVFQQRPSWGSYRDRTDVATSARLFYKAAIPVDKSDPTRPYWDLCATVQRPREDLRDEYDLYKAEAEKFVTAFGIPGGDLEGSAAAANSSVEPDGGYEDGGVYMYYRWDPSHKNKGKKENSWDCIQRLAEEVNWRAYFVYGRFYFMSEDQLFKQKPAATIREFTSGVDDIGGDYDQGKKWGQLTFDVRVGRWQVPPGSVVVLRDMGPWNGRWLVTEIDRDLFAATATLTLKKPSPKLPEPQKNNFDDGTGWGSPNAAADQVYKSSEGIVWPLPTPGNFNKSEFMVPDPEGAPLNPDGSGGRYHGAKDWFAPGGTIVISPVTGTIVEVKQSKGNSGQVFGGVVKVQQPNGYVFVFRHVDPIGALAVGAQVQQRTPIAAVTTWADNPSGSHSHIEIWKTLEGGYRISNMVDPALFFAEAAV